MSRAGGRPLAGLLVLMLGLAATLLALMLHELWIGRDGTSRDGGTTGAAGATTAAGDPAAVERGRYLALAGNCAGCHTAPGGADYAGGVGVATPYGTVYAGNLTPDPATGLGAWSAGDFRRAMHDGRSRDGRLLYPAFPYTNFTLLTRNDTDALFAFLRSLRPVVRPPTPHTLRFPYDTQLTLAAWRLLAFRPGGSATDTTQSPAWNRGAYLVRALGHCNACHAPRGLFAAVDDRPELRGGHMSEAHWYAPPLAPDPADAADRSSLQQRWARLLRSGVDGTRSTSGPMADVVYRSTQHLREDDLQAMALFLSRLPARPAAESVPLRPADPARLEAGRQLYTRHCEDCHGVDGRGRADAYPPLAGNPALLAEPPTNMIRMVIEGGFLPATAANPRPFGMPPFAPLLSSAQIADVLSHVRNAWGNRAAPLGAHDVERHR